MGVFRQVIEIGPSPAGPFRPVEAVVDTGASYTQVPRSVLDSVGLSATEQAEFTLAGGRTVRRGIAEAYVRLGGKVRATLCIVGEDGAQALLGAYTLEGFGLTADPVNKRLVPTTLYLL
ncbi:MAG: retroviral-like aspartic protease family protein [Armatimonadota bacterium]|nr:retroviral-like aspartic protease family protein [Armatimonadota bacterium]MDR7450404.1 retroviral-like aspartic protease family protein [Armatimonadota bacterium]MDR7467013.1 retroviral-like aspartic protease family protein [Armatimonadota bacterium]MDR7493445.1 retroviral-like aspartic protease family protein [Armatimonadota bacterium]MDR7498710.1 retroviral-like aspartic protease family protein [Armatimonadota bacterium]